MAGSNRLRWFVEIVARCGRWGGYLFLFELFGQLTQDCCGLFRGLCFGFNEFCEGFQICDKLSLGHVVLLHSVPPARCCSGGCPPDIIYYNISYPIYQLAVGTNIVPDICAICILYPIYKYGILYMRREATKWHLQAKHSKELSASI